jgi:hypothetical protein
VDEHHIQVVLVGGDISIEVSSATEKGKHPARASRSSEASDFDPGPKLGRAVAVSIDENRVTKIDESLAQPCHC